ncbi:hypothetical protein WAF17_02040 [Bernardetia sp. ABR2-2B]|uniref:hypothetical protein n=1 Tax=Bernardetia sp. ABR2-2B TaxID=3127472 RepID=UPI0030CBEBB8
MKINIFRFRPKISVKILLSLIIILCPVILLFNSIFSFTDEEIKDRKIQRCNEWKDLEFIGRITQIKKGNATNKYVFINDKSYHVNNSNFKGHPSSDFTVGDSIYKKKDNTQIFLYKGHREIIIESVLCD